VTLWAAVVGWALVVCLALQAARLTHRLNLVAEADHELRGPVSALTLAVESLGRRPDLSRRAQALDTHLDRLRIGLADLAAARSGRRAAPRRADVPLEGLLRAAAEAWQPAARHSGGEIRVDWRAGDVAAQADRRRLSQAIGNVLANAVEHTTSRHGAGERSAGEQAPARDRGRGLGIAAAALRHAHGSLETPDLAHGPRRRGRLGVEVSGTGRPTPEDDRPPAPAGRGARVTVEVPVVERPG
jgi:signal transduction histidine kinase